jgi:hypothetical protein
VRFARKRDATEPAIYNALSAAHCDPQRGNDIDIYAVSRADMKVVYLEVKVPGRRESLRPIQAWFKANSTRYHVVTSVDEALKACGVTRWSTCR